nr:MAG TPA: hypothetical protein [Caudoviricetes sp.]
MVGHIIYSFIVLLSSLNLRKFSVLRHHAKYSGTVIKVMQSEVCLH